jgi:hypothetical protein
MLSRKKGIRVLRMLFLLANAGAVFLGVQSCAQENRPSEFLSVVGDAPEVAPTPATDISPSLNRAAVEKATLKVANWQLDRVRHDFDWDCTFAACAQASWQFRRVNRQVRTGLPLCHRIVWAPHLQCFGKGRSI